MAAKLCCQFGQPLYYPAVLNSPLLRLSRLSRTWSPSNQSAGPPLAGQKRKNMKLVKTLVLAAVTLAFCSGSVFAGCCDATVEAGKKCEHKCCIKASKDGK